MISKFFRSLGTIILALIISPFAFLSSIIPYLIISSHYGWTFLNFLFFDIVIAIIVFLTNSSDKHNYLMPEIFDYNYFVIIIFKDILVIWSLFFIKEFLINGSFKTSENITVIVFYLISIVATMFENYDFIREDY